MSWTPCESPRKLTWLAGTSTILHSCISYWKWMNMGIFQCRVIVFRGVSILCFLISLLQNFAPHKLDQKEMLPIDFAPKNPKVQLMISFQTWSSTEIDFRIDFSFKKKRCYDLNFNNQDFFHCSSEQPGELPYASPFVFYCCDVDYERQIVGFLRAVLKKVQRLISKMCSKMNKPSTY